MICIQMPVSHHVKYVTFVSFYKKIRMWQQILVELLLSNFMTVSLVVLEFLYVYT
jgi:hypothetical protein